MMRLQRWASLAVVGVGMGLAQAAAATDYACHTVRFSTVVSFGVYIWNTGTTPTTFTFSGYNSEGNLVIGGSAGVGYIKPHAFAFQGSFTIIHFPDGTASTIITSPSNRLLVSVVMYPYVYSSIPSNYSPIQLPCVAMP